MGVQKLYISGETIGNRSCHRPHKGFVGDEDFIVFLGDNYLNDELSSLYDAYSSDEMDGMFTLRKLRVLHSSVQRKSER